MEYFDEVEMITYNSMEKVVKDKIDLCLVLNDLNYKTIIDDIIFKYPDTKSLVEDAKEYSYIKDKYGELPIDKLNKYLEEYWNGNIQQN